MINYQNIIADMIRDRSSGSGSSLADSGNDTLRDAESWALLALRGEWLARLLQQAAGADRAEGRSADVAVLRARLQESGVLLELLRSFDNEAGPRDHKRWARKILARIAAGESGVTHYQARAALEALCSPD